jgi:hypothetical protein
VDDRCGARQCGAWIRGHSVGCSANNRKIEHSSNIGSNGAKEIFSRTKLTVLMRNGIAGIDIERIDIVAKLP